MPPEDGDPLAVMLPLKGDCKPGKCKAQGCESFADDDQVTSQAVDKVD